MKFQTLIEHKKGTGIYVNGRVIPIDAYGCVDVVDPAEIKTFQALATEWSPTIRQVVPKAAVPAPVQAKTAADLVSDLAVDSTLLAKITGMRSPTTRRSFLETQGYRFTDAELAAALEPVSKEPTAEVAADVSAAVQNPPAADVQKDTQPSPEKNPGTWAVPADGEEWPDPTPDMPVPFLRAMADAYEVKWPAKMKVEDAIKRILKAMYPKGK